MKLQGIKIIGRSVSGYATAITLPELGISFDCGYASHKARQCPTVLITHGHLDHLGDIHKHAYIRGMTGMTPSHFIVPPWLEGPVHEIFRFWAKVQKARKAPYKVTVIREGERVEVEGGRFVRCFKTDHRIPSQGYVVLEERKRLKAEFVGTPGKELGRMRREGIEFEDIVEVPLVAFTGDTRAEVFDNELLALKAKVLISECTFLPGVSIAEARKKGHVHIDQLAERAGRFSEVGSLVLAHFSKRYRNAEVEEAIANLPHGLREKTTHLSLGS